jgi:PAS domain S-box-containing protein
VADVAQSNSDVPLDGTIVDSGVPLEAILRTEELYRRPSRPPDYEKENRSLLALVSMLSDSPRSILQALAEKVLEVLQADSAGLSLLTKDEKRFYWAAIAGAWQPHTGGGTPRDSGPCGDVLNRNIPMLFTHWERRYPYLGPATPLAEEGLLVPFYVNGKAVGTIWAIAHTSHRNFDTEDLRLLESLGRFASVAYQAVASIDDLKFQVSEREKAEAALQDLAKGLEAKVQRLVDANIIGIVMWNIEGQITEANEAFLRMVGYDREDLLSGRVSWREVTPDRWRAADERALAELAATGVCEPFEKEYFRKDGSCVAVLVGAALLEESGNDGVAFVLDLTERKLAEDARARQASVRADVSASLSKPAHLGEILQGAAEAIVRHLDAAFARIWTLNKEKNMLELQASAGMYTHLDGSHSRIQFGKLKIGLIAQEKKPHLTNDVLNDPRVSDKAWARNEGMVAFAGYPLIVQDRLVGVMAMFARQSLSATTLDALASIADSVAQGIERERTEEALRKSQAELAHVARVSTLGEMSASIAHEVNQPLTAVVTSANACLRWLDAQKLEEARRSASRVIAEAHRASEIIGRIRSLTKKAPPQKDWLDINETIHEVIALARSEIQRNDIVLETQLSDQVPLISADRVQLQQVILNLVMNAIEALSGVHDGPRELLIRSDMDESEDVLISVQDSGPGIDPESLDHLFDAFYTTKPHGLGMGLAISRSIMDAHGGRLWPTANSPRGAIFQFILPINSEKVA